MPVLVGGSQPGSPGAQPGLAGTGSGSGSLPGSSGSVSLPPAPPRTIVIGRQFNVQVKINGTPLEAGYLVGFRISYAINQPVPKCSLVTRRKLLDPDWPGDYDSTIEIYIGTTLASWSSPVPSAVNGVSRSAPSTNGMPLRFVGRLRDELFNPYPALRTTDCIGVLGLAAEFFNNVDTHAIGGLTINNFVLHKDQDGVDVTVTDSITGLNGSSTAGVIISAVLDKVPSLTVNGVRQWDPADIHDTGMVYPPKNNAGIPMNAFYATWLWRAGVPQGSVAQGRALAFQPQAGESALDYIRRWNQIEAKFTPDPSPPPPPGVAADSGGFYILMQTLDGKIRCIFMGGRPRNALDTSIDGSEIVFTEGVNIISQNSSVTRKYPQGNITVTKGFDWGQNSTGGFYYKAAGSNKFMQAPNDQHYDPNPISSDMITFASNYQRTTLGCTGGMDCQTISSCRLLDINRIEVNGTIETPEDYLMSHGGTHLIQGTGGQAIRLGTGEPCWCQSLDIDFHVGQMGEPIFRQHATYRGGGVPYQVP